MLGLSLHANANDKSEKPAPVTTKSPFELKFASMLELYLIVHAAPPGLSVQVLAAPEDVTLVTETVSVCPPSLRFVRVVVSTRCK